MKDDFIYVPIVKWKQGEQGALKELDERISNKIIPLIEITPEVNVTKFKDSLSNWDEKYFYFDVIPEVYEEYPEEIYYDLLEKCKKDYVIPVMSLSDEIEDINRTISLSKNGIALRIVSDDFENLDTQLTQIKDYIDYKDIDLIIDLKVVNENNIGEKRIVMKALMSDIPNINLFRNIIIASSSFPKTLSNYDKYELFHISRYDFQLWKSLDFINSKYGVKLIYCDYCINDPSHFEFIIGMTPSFNIRYTHENSYIIVRGDTIKKGGLDSDKISNLCNKIINSGYFLDKDFSWGDEYIFTRCNDDAKGFGSLTTWRKVGTNHHITFVVNQLSNLL